MNADIVYTLCSYLDVRSLLALAAADTIWSPLVRMYMKKEELEVELTLECEVNVETLRYKEYYRQESDVLPKPIWKEVSSRVLDIVSVAITQKDGSAISEDAYALLTKITTSSLVISFHSRGEARRVIRTITLRLRSHVTLFEDSTGPDLEPILVQSEMARFEKIRYYGSTVTLYKDLMQALDTEIVIVVIVQYDDAENRPGAAWIASAIEEYSAAKPLRVQWARLGPSGYIVETVPEGGATRINVAKRAITVSSCASPTKPLSLRDEPTFIVTNDFE